jgi:hypothetical protein
MKRVILSGAVVFLILAILAACSGSSSTSSTTKVTLAISPTSASVTTATTQQFTVTVTNTTNTNVTFSVNGVVGGNQTVGFISSAGLYTAPNSVPTPATVTVTAVSQADTSVTISATVTVTASAAGTAQLTVSPNPVTMPAGGIQTFSATVNNVAIAVNWTLNCQSVVVGACGTVTAAGVYTAPPSPPPGGTVSLTASAKDNSAAPASAQITVQFSNGTLNGKYAFTLSGQVAGVSYVAAGSISFDGSGAITGGTIDINSGGVASTVTINAGGTYHVGTDGRGNATFTTSPGSVTVNWQFAVVNHSRAFVARFDSGVQSASGVLELQDASQFTATGFSGNYSFNLSGANASSKPGSLAVAGALQSNGALLISGGVQDVNNGGSPSTGVAIGGSYTTPSATFGNGTMLLNGTGFAYYIVDATHVKVVGTAAAAQLVGDLYKQPAGPFTNASLRGGFVFAFLGSTSAGAFGEGGVIALDGAGNVPNGTIDINAHGNPQSALAVSGTYSVADATTGRTTATLQVGGVTYLYAFYPQINGALSVVEIDTTNVVSGRALAQSLGPFSGGSFQGNFAFNLTGTDVANNPGEEDMVGQMLPNGGSALNTSSVDINDNGVLAPSAALSGSYQVSASGRGSPVTLTTNSTAFSSATMAMYIADSGDVLFLESDGTRVMVGLAQKQY